VGTDLQKRLIPLIARIAADPRDGNEAALQKMLLVSLSLVCVVAGVLWGLVYIAVGAASAGTIPLLYAAMSLASTVVFGVSGSFRSYRIIQLGLILLLPWLMMISLGGFHNSSAVVVRSGLCPLGALLFHDLRGASRWLLAFLGLLAGTFFVPLPHAVTLYLPLISVFYAMNIGAF